MTRRHEQLEEVIRRTLQESLRKGIADPRVRGIISVGHVKLAPDMADATAFISAYPAENLDLVLHGLKSATPHLRRDLARRANLRRTPRLWFKKDAGIFLKPESWGASQIGAAGQIPPQMRRRTLQPVQDQIQVLCGIRADERRGIRHIGSQLHMTNGNNAADAGVRNALAQ